MKHEIKNAVTLKGRLCNIKRHFYKKTNIVDFSAYLEIKRNSGVIDYIPIKFTNRTFSKLPKDFSFVKVEGYFNSCMKNSKLLLYVWASQIEPLCSEEYENSFLLKGALCKLDPIRETSLNHTLITDFFINVGNYYFPCIAWNSAAIAISKLPLGTYIELLGRLQSREYIKKYDENNIQTRTAYELSTMSFFVSL